MCCVVNFSAGVKGVGWMAEEFWAGWRRRGMG